MGAGDNEMMMIAFITSKESHALCALLV